MNEKCTSDTCRVVSHALGEQEGRFQDPGRSSPQHAQRTPPPATYAQVACTSRSQAEDSFHMVHGTQKKPGPSGASIDALWEPSSTADPFSNLHQGAEKYASPTRVAEMPVKVEFCPGCLKTNAPPSLLEQTLDKLVQWIDRRSIDSLRKHAKTQTKKLREMVSHDAMSQRQLQELQQKLNRQASEMADLKSSNFLLASQKQQLEVNLRDARLEARIAQKHADDMEYKAGELQKVVKVLEGKVAKFEPLAEKVPGLESDVELLQERLSESIREAQHQKMQALELETQLKGTPSGQQSVETAPASKLCTSFEIGFGVVEQLNLLNSIAVYSENLAQMIMKIGGHNNQAIREKLHIQPSSSLACCRTLVGNQKKAVAALCLQHVLVLTAWQRAYNVQHNQINNVHNNMTAFLQHFKHSVTEVPAHILSQVVSHMYRCIYISVDNHLKQTVSTDDGYATNAFNNMCDEMAGKLLQEWGLHQACFRELQKLCAHSMLLSLLVKSLAFDVPGLAVAISAPGVKFDAVTMERPVREVPCPNLDRPVVLCCTRPGLQYQTHDGVRHVLVKTQVAMLVPGTPLRPQPALTCASAQTTDHSAVEPQPKSKEAEQPGEAETQSSPQSARSTIAPPPAGPEPEMGKVTDNKPGADTVQPQMEPNQEPQAPPKGLAEALIARAKGTAMQTTRLAADSAIAEAAAGSKPEMNDGKLVVETVQSEHGCVQQLQCPEQRNVSNLVNQVSGDKASKKPLNEPPQEVTGGDAPKRDVIPEQARGYAGSVVSHVGGVHQFTSKTINLQQDQPGHGLTSDAAGGVPGNIPQNIAHGQMHDIPPQAGSSGNSQPQGQDASHAAHGDTGPMETDEYEYAMVEEP